MTKKMETVRGFIFLGSKITANGDWATILKDACSLEEKLWQTIEQIKKHRHHFANKGPYSQSYGFPSSHEWMWELGHKEGWALKN